MRNSAIGSNRDDFEKKNFTPEEITASDARVKRAVKFILQDDFGTINSETANELKNKFNYDYTTNPRFPTIELEKIDDLRELESILLPVYGMIIDFYNIDGRAPGTPNLPRIFLYDGLIEGMSND